jgi:hypothetical protein
MAIIAWVTEGVSIKRILGSIGEPATPPPIASARDPPRWVDDIDQTPAYDPTLAQSAPQYKFDPIISW